MRILYDHQIFTILRFGGISRYFAELYKGLSRDPSFRIDCSVQSSDNINYQKIVLDHSHFTPSAVDAFFKKVRGKIFPSTKEGIVNYNLSVEQLSRQEFDLFHPTYYDPYFLEHLNGKPYVVTVHDMIHELFPDYFDHQTVQNLKRHKKRVIESANHIISVSEHTKSDLISLLKIPQEKITVVYHGSSFLPYYSKENMNNSLPSKYLLFVGTREIYKNFNFFVESITQELIDQKDLYLICAGAKFTKQEKQYLASHNLEKKVIQRFSTDVELKTLYQNALALVYPSKYEGFGLPILEAFACGCPVVSSNASSLPEVGGDAVIYFSPENGVEAEQQIKRMISDQALRAQCIEKGFERLNMFSWEKTVEQTKSVYRKVLS